jgi:two-component system KDP operon response regulator KdpE
VVETVNVLIIEDSPQVIKDISFCLRLRYPAVIIVSAAEWSKGIEMVESESPNLVMLDSSLPDIDTWDLVSKIRDFSDVPLMVLSEAETDLDRAKNLEAGADEYIIKPFSPIDLLARVRALLRRTQGFDFRQERFLSQDGELIIDFDTHEVFISNKRVMLTPTEYNMFLLLVRSYGRVITHRTLLEKVWGSEYSHDYSFVKKYIYRLRSKIESDARNPKMLLTERGVGYRFVIPV